MPSLLDKIVHQNTYFLKLAYSIMASRDFNLDFLFLLFLAGSLMGKSKLLCFCLRQTSWSTFTWQIQCVSDHYIDMSKARDCVFLRNMDNRSLKIMHGSERKTLLLWNLSLKLGGRIKKSVILRNDLIGIKSKQD